MADVLTNNGEEWMSERCAGVQGGGTNNVAGNNGSHIGIGTSATAPTKADTALGAEVETRGATTVTVSGSGSAAKYSATTTSPISITAPRALAECGLFSASAAGVMFTHSTFSTINLVSGDSISVTITIDPS